MLKIDTIRRDVILQNSFSLWLIGLVLILTGIPVISALICAILHAPVWTIPKTYELKIYALAMILCFFIPLLSNYMPLVLKTDHPWFRYYLLFFYPIAVVLFSFPSTELLRYLSVFILSLVGVFMLVYDLLNNKKMSYLGFDRYYNQTLIASISLSVFFIVLKSPTSAFNLYSPWLVLVFLLAYQFLRFSNLHERYSKKLIYLLPIILFALTFYTMDDVSAAKATIFHYSFFLGPVIEVLYGHYHPLMVDAQYGSGTTAFLALYFKAQNIISMESMQRLLEVLAFVQYLLVYFIASALYRSRRIAFLALITILIFNFYSMSTYYYMCPSIGFLRFGFIYLIIGCYLLEGKWLSEKTLFFAISIIGTIAFLWSFESAVYTLPALFFTEYQNKNLKKFLPIFLGCFIIIIAAYLSPFILQGKWPLLTRYYEYAMVYSGGFGQVPLSRLTSFWWLFPLLYGFILTRIVLGYTENRIVVALTIYGMAIFTYFVGRADPNNLFHVSIPFILLSIYLILNLNSIALFAKQIFLSLTLVVFLSATYQWADNGEMIIKKIVSRNFTVGINHLLPISAQIKMRPIPEVEPMLPLSDFISLEKFKKDGAFALLSGDTRFHQLYAMTHTHNAFSANPYFAIAINPNAIKRTIAKASIISNFYLLVDSDLLKNPYDRVNSNLTAQVLKTMSAKKLDEFKVGDLTLVVFKSELSASLSDNAK